MSGNIQVTISKVAKKILRDYQEKNDFRNLDIALDKFIVKHGGKK